MESWNAVEAVAFDAVVRRDDAQQHLHQDQSRDDPEVFERGALRRRGRPAAQRIGSRERARRLFRLAARRTTRPSPQMPASSMMMLTPVQTTALAGGAVADQRLVRPVVACSVMCVAGPIGGGGPRGPEEERREAAAGGPDRSRLPGGMA